MGRLVCISAPFVCISGEWALPVATSGAKVGENWGVDYYFFVPIIPSESIIPSHTLRLTRHSCLHSSAVFRRSRCAVRFDSEACRAAIMLNMDRAKLVSEFEEAMFTIYQRALSEAGYKATRFLAMLNEEGGIATASRLIHAANVSEGYTALWERGHLDLTVEALILDNERWHTLFSSKDLEVCAARLTEYGYKHA